jgi:hypothetical protein
MCNSLAPLARTDVSREADPDVDEFVGEPMQTPMTIRDHLERARIVYGDRVGVFDEPDQPAPSLGDLTYSQFYDLAHGMAAGLDDLGLEQGARVGIVSQNSARLLVTLFGPVPGAEWPYRSTSDSAPTRSNTSLIIRAATC